MKNEDLYLEVGKKILEFQKEIHVNTKESAKVFIKNVINACPKIIYYLRGYSCAVSSSGMTMRMEYQNQSYPKQSVHVVYEKNLEYILRESVINYQKTLVLILPQNVNFQWAMECFMKKSMDFYPNLKGYQTRRMKFEEIPLLAYEIDFKYRIGTVMLKTMDLNINEKVKQIKNTFFRMNMPDSVKCFVVHNYLADTVQYYNEDNGSPLERSYVQSAYGALINKKCVCHGYAEAYKRILDELDVPCDIVTGQILDGTGEWHAWNIVHLKNNSLHCHVDVTWDSNRGNGDKTYFLKDDSYFAFKREWNKYYFTPCQDGGALIPEIKKYCATHKKELLECGILEKWLV